ncbi:nucleotidyltransferase domain-containing protein [Hanamia caeni]|jgi:predicted nucleotidyltransferase|uniref:Nucleotidyltransferase domain-containing protein n=1 Tax=Hanamia caeni TaxID=2294116 RepID=A0A3M9NBK3_9BACT|nr:nucleotidyltransferase domain-containing protein [Hanamia caeni]RNI35192.1 nucleotidyltransferase domain-containing protein [Hanamia caeni]
MNDSAPTQFGLSKMQLQLILGVINNFEEIEKALIFGSRATEKYKPGSDIDLALIGDKLTSLLINRVSSALDDLPLPFMFDVINYHELNNQLLKKKIDDEGKLLYERKLNTV